jgi:hypothetical protein
MVVETTMVSAAHGADSEFYRLFRFITGADETI